MKTQSQRTFGATHNVIYEEGVKYAKKKMRKERPRVESLFSVFIIYFRFIFAVNSRVV